MIIISYLDRITLSGLILLWEWTWLSVVRAPWWPTPVSLSCKLLALLQELHPTFASVKRHKQHLVAFTRILPFSLILSPSVSGRLVEWDKIILIAGNGVFPCSCGMRDNPTERERCDHVKRVTKHPSQKIDGNISSVMKPTDTDYRWSRKRQWRT